MPGENKLLRLSFTNLQDCIANGIGKNRLVWIAEIKNRKNPLVLVDAVEATKAKTVITDDMDLANETKYLESPLAGEDLFNELYELARTIQGEFVTKKRDGGYLVPKRFQMCMAASLAARVHKERKVRMTLAAGQGKTMVYLLAAMLLHRKFPQQYPRILCVTISNPLKTQLDGIVLNHPIDFAYKSMC